MSREVIQHPFPPVVDSRSRILILGSFPSVRSRADGFYYAHPQNRFWRMLSLILDAPLPESTEEKKCLLLAHGLALWDSAASVSIEGSMDASVRNATPVAIEEVLSVAPIAQIVCNGALAGKLYHRYLEPVTGLSAHILPSTSPANASWSLEKLVSAWAPYLILHP